MIRPEIDAGELSIPKNLPIIIHKITDYGYKTLVWFIECKAVNISKE